MLTDARICVPVAGSENSESEVEDELEEEEFDLETRNEEIAAESENGSRYRSPLSAPPNFRKAIESSDIVDPWSSGLDPWRREITSSFAEKFRNAGSPVTSATSFADKYRTPPAKSSA